MTAKQKKETVIDLFQVWIAKLGLQQWGIELIFHREACQVQTNTPYKQALIHFNIVDLDESELEEYVIHELLHIFLSDYRWWVRKILERITPQEADIFNDIDEGITDALMRVLKKEV